MSETLSQLSQIFINQLQDDDPRLSNLPVGSTYDALSGATAYAVNEAQVENELAYQKHFIQTAEGNDLDLLATDQYSSDFARPQPIAASGFVTFYLNAETTTVNIDTGVIVKTSPTSVGVVVRYSVTAPGTLIPVTQTSVTLPVTCIQIGAIGDVPALAINQIESPLTSSLITCSNAAAISNGEDALTDGQYRDYIYELLATFRRYTAAIIESAALSVLGPQGFAQATETELQVIEWDGTAPVGAQFQINRAFLYVGYLTGSITSGVITQIQSAIKRVKALGVFVNVIGVLGVAIDFTIKVVLNPSGPNYSRFVSGDFSDVNLLMKDNILVLPIVSALNPTVTFVVATQVGYISALYSADFASITVITPSSDVVITTTDDKFIPQNYGVILA